MGRWGQADRDVPRKLKIHRLLLRSFSCRRTLDFDMSRLFVIVSLIILCTLRRVAEHRGSTYTRHDRPHRIEDLSYKIIGELIPEVASTTSSWTGSRETREKIIIQTIDPRYCRIKCLLECLYLSLASSPLYNNVVKETYIRPKRLIQRDRKPMPVLREKRTSNLWHNKL